MMTSREKIWVDAWVAVAASNNCTDVAIPTKWADICLADFDNRFPRAKELNEEALRDTVNQILKNPPTFKWV